MIGIESGVSIKTLFVGFAVVALALATCVILGQCVQNARFLRAYHRDVVQRFNALRIHKMLETLGVSRRRYMGSALSVEVEKHLQRCGHCPNTDACDRILREGDLSKANDICPNFEELVRYRPRRLDKDEIR